MPEDTDERDFDPKKNVMGEREAIRALSVIQKGGTEEGILQLDSEVRVLDARAKKLRGKRDALAVEIENKKAAGIFGRAHVFFGGSQTELTKVEEELAQLQSEMAEKSKKVFRGITTMQNIVHEIVSGKVEYRQVEVIEGCLSRAASNLKAYLDAIIGAQDKVEGALNAGAGEEAAQMVGTGIAIPVEMYNKAADEAIEAVKVEAKNVHRVLNEYASNMDAATVWKVRVAIDRESALNVDVLSRPEYLDMYTPKKLEELQAQLAGLREAVAVLRKQIKKSQKDLTNQKNSYQLTEMKRLCKGRDLHLFNEDEYQYHKVRAQGNWSGEEKLPISEEGDDEDEESNEANAE